MLDRTLIGNVSQPRGKAFRPNNPMTFCGATRGIMRGVECLPRRARLLQGDFRCGTLPLLRVKAADGLGLASDADVGAGRLRAVGARAVDAVIGPPIAIRRTGLHRNIGCVGCSARWDREFSRAGGVASGDEHRQRESDQGQDIAILSWVIWPHAVFLKRDERTSSPAGNPPAKRFTATRPW